MKRRGFVKTGLVTMAAGASSNLAFGEIIIPVSENISHFEMEDFISKMDLCMDRISFSGGNYLKKLFPQSPSETEQDFLKSSLRTLLLIGNFGDLPIKGQAHPWMQERLLYSAHEINYSVTGSIDILKNMSDESLEDIRTALTDDPDLGDRIMEALDLDAQAIGVSAARRRQMRLMGKRINARLKHSPDMLISEYVKKADKLILACNSNEALEQLLRAQVGEADYSKKRTESEIAALYWNNLNIPDIPVGYKPIITYQDDNQQTKEQTALKNKKALRLLGIGGITTAVGWILIGLGTSIGLVPGVTIGPLLILIALIMLLVNAIKSRGSRE
ncbi:MAG: hypothetical protein IH591_15875 [Bacteroidales bacterium]|nr:hypothetical protein [Bacteroidales bacterium]